jgi:hypothetical protein
MSGTNIAPHVFRNASGKIVGRLAPDGFLEKTGIDFNKHHLHKYHGWATDSSHLEELREKDGRGIRLILVGGTILQSRLIDWRQHGFTSPHLEGHQTVLPDRFWSDPSEPPTVAAPRQRPPTAPTTQIQLSMTF